MPWRIGLRETRDPRSFSWKPATPAVPATASRDPTAPATDLRERSTAPVHHVWAGTGPVHPTVVRGGRGNARNPTDLPMAAAHYRRRQRTTDAITSLLRVDFILLATKAQPLACDNARNHVELYPLASRSCTPLQVVSFPLSQLSSSHSCSWPRFYPVDVECSAACIPSEAYKPSLLKAHTYTLHQVSHGKSRDTDTDTASRDATPA